MRYFIPFILLLTLLLLQVPLLLANEIYTFIDAEGTIHFTNVPTDTRYKKMVTVDVSELRSEPIDRAGIDALIHKAARLQRISPSLIKAVIRAESNFIPTAVSSAGAQGLMQIMPATAEDLKLSDPFDPAENIEGGSRYIRYLLDQFGQDVSLAIAAYHAGPGRVSRYGGIPPIKQTKHYLKKVLKFYDVYLKEAAQKKAEASKERRLSNPSQQFIASSD